MIKKLTKKGGGNMDKKNIIISLQGVNKVFDGTTVVDNFNLDITKGEFVTFLGPSGCGKKKPQLLWAKLVLARVLLLT